MVRDACQNTKTVNSVSSTFVTSGGTLPFREFMFAPLVLRVGKQSWRVSSSWQCKSVRAGVFFVFIFRPSDNSKKNPNFSKIS